MAEMDVRRSGKRRAVQEAGIATITAIDTDDRTPVERAWADLCDCKDNPDVERVMASIGGWGAWAETPLTLLAFTGAFNGDVSAAERALAKHATKAGGA
jgi:hypothetical protein